MEDNEFDDEEISLDFGKIKKVFGKKEGDEQKAEEQGEDKIRETRKESSHAPEKPEEFDEGKEEEISLDFGKVKGIFKKIKSQDSEKIKSQEDSEDEISFDAKKVFEKGYGFVKDIHKSKKIIIPVLFILIAVFLSVYIRVQPAYLPITDDWARSSVYNYYSGQISAEVDRQYPNLPDVNKKEILDSEVAKVFRENKREVDEQIRQTSEFFKSQLKDDSGQTYLLAIDPYYWMRHASNIINNGHPGDEIRGGVPYDSYMFAPKGRPIPADMFHAYFEAYMYKIIKFFDRDVSLMAIAFYMPIIICALAVIPAFFIARSMGGNYAGLVAGILIAVHPALVTRTAGGFADTDAYTVFFPLLITWLFLMAFETKSRIKNIALAISAGFFVGLFSFTWMGWWYIFDFLLATMVIYLIYYIVIHWKELKGNYFGHKAIRSAVILVVIFFLASGLFVTIFRDYNTFVSSVKDPISFTKLKEVAKTKIWPNVYTTVAEQNPQSWNAAISGVGLGGKTRGKLGLFIAGAGIILVAFRKDRYGKLDLKYSLLLTLWLVATLYASVKGVRFSILVVPAFAVSFGVALGIFYDYSVRWISKELHISRIFPGIVIFVLLGLLLIAPVRAGIGTARSELPSMNDAWYSALKSIDDRGSSSAIINSWWDFGHWFKAIGNRPVTFDGTSQNSPQAHWIGLTLLTDDEDLAVGILRMLDCGANDAFYKLDEYIDDTVRSVDILHEIVVLDRDDARNVLLEKGLNEQQAESVLEFTHCEPPEDYFITSQDMIQKSGVWAHFGSWDFTRALMYNQVRNKKASEGINILMEKFNVTENQAENLYQEIQTSDANNWIAPWPGYASGINGCSKTSEIIVCSIPQGGRITVNLTTMQADIPTQQGTMHPDSIAYINKEGFFVKKFNESTMGLSMILIPTQDGNYGNILSSPQLAESMFTRMFFLRGHGLKHFKLFDYRRSMLGGDEVYVWKVDWEGGEPNYAASLFPQEPEEEAGTEEQEILNQTGQIVENATGNSS